jgi:hypothetical protein
MLLRFLWHSSSLRRQRKVERKVDAVDLLD